MAEPVNQAPGAPGIPPRWTSSAKTGVGTALTDLSRVWFTLSHGILNEIYFPRIDFACTRDFGLIVTGPDGFFSEEKRHTTHETRWLEDGLPAFELINTCVQGRYRISKRIVADPQRDVVLQQIRFEVLTGAVADYRLFALLAPHLVNGGADNSGWLDAYKGDDMLFASGDGTALALASSHGFRARSVGFVGASDGWQDLSRHGSLTSIYTRADGGNVALTGELDIKSAATEGIVLALGFGNRGNEAALRARSSLQDGFEKAFTDYVGGWRECMRRTRPIDVPALNFCTKLYHASVAMLLSHEPPTFPGAIIASLSIPWGFSKGDDDLGGYHLVWPRDLAETAGGLLAAGLHDEALSVLNYLQSVQESDGSWPQNMWIDGSHYWSGIQLDECAFPILLVDMLRREKCLDDISTRRYLPMVRSAVAFVVRNGAATGQDRWEEDAGYSPFTLGVTIAALLAAADILDLYADEAFAQNTFSMKQNASPINKTATNKTVANFLRETADSWNDNIEAWTYTANTQLANSVGVDGYYVRIAPLTTGSAAATDGLIAIKNRADINGDRVAKEIVSPDALALVRFGLRAADDPRILNTVKVIDHLLKIDLPNGPVWRRYNEDGYGEHADGRAFNGTGIGRGWPLLTGERAHYEIARGDKTEARHLLQAMAACASAGGLLPEQVWDADDIPERELFRGRPSGSAMPLVWAHSEYIKLVRSLLDDRVFDQPQNTVQRYLVEKKQSPLVSWRINQARQQIPAGKILRIELDRPATIHWSLDNWQTTTDSAAVDSNVGIYYFDIPSAALTIGQQIAFTFYWSDEQRWLGNNFTVDVNGHR
ncbi:MAG: glucan 1,4-alpha-glucosidase [Verrucomicrobiaceae bacterium]|nr:glucan 1,4-alpha-glucosidase [Verrucomicrobiaceae bacterium]